MTLRDMTPRELELFEEEVVRGAEDRDRDREPAPADPLLEGEVTPEDDDGLPDGPAKHRVPS